MSGKAKPVEGRFWEKVNKSSGCWSWVAHKNPKGYGKFNDGAAIVLAHRFSWILHRGSIPMDRCVLHKCDNPCCVNPAHLFVGTRADNNADMRKKGRAAFGERNAQSRLSEQDVRSILGDRRKQCEIASEYDVDPSTISYIKTRKKWAHV